MKMIWPVVLLLCAFATSTLSQLSDCRVRRCFNGGICRRNRGIYECICRKGYVGQRCELADCSKVPCINGGTCRRIRKIYRCSCRRGYTGRRCEYINCKYIKCLNGGSCRRFGSRNKCHCREGYYGVRCEHYICKFVKCLNGGTCKPYGRRYRCKCRRGYIGRRCQRTDCRFFRCYNRGVCKRFLGSYKCDCRPGFIGYRCQSSICKLGRCLNGGTCKIYGRTYKCECRRGYIGLRCQLTDCRYFRCYNGGICRSSGSLNKCICQRGYTGPRCERTDCRFFRCFNGGTCTRYLSSYRCQCVAGYTGLRCQYCVCRSGTCLNGGICRVRGRSYVCFCRRGYYGRRCELSTNNIIFLVDESSVVGRRNFEKLLFFTAMVISKLGISDRTISIGLYTYSTRINRIIPLRNYRDKGELILRIVSLGRYYKGGRTNTACALSYVHRLLRRFRKESTVIVVTGSKSINSRATAIAAARLQAIASKVYAVGLGPAANKLELISIASATSYVYHTAYILLGKLSTVLARRIGYVSVWPNCMPGTCLNGGTCERYRMRYKCFCQPGYTGPRCEWYTRRGLRCNRPCRNNSHCPEKMNCCEGCCKNSVTILSKFSTWSK